MIKFYTYAPVEYPWILRNIKQKPLDFASHEIVDCGIDDLKKDPHKHSFEKIQKWKNLKINGWKVVPDCPHIAKEFGIDTDIDNVEYSKELILELYNPEDKTQLPVIQGYYHEPESFRKYGQWFLKQYPIPKKIGIGTICKAGNARSVEETTKIARSLFPNTFIHIFGLRRQHLKLVYKYIDSYDSTAWTKSRESGKSSCRNKKERIQYFEDYINTMPGYYYYKKNKEQKKLDQYWKNSLI